MSSASKRLTVLLLALLPYYAGAQCCSMGSPAGASTYVGVLAKNHFRFITFYRHNFLNTYYEKDHISNTSSMLIKSYFNFAGVTFSYGITKRLTTELDIGYFINKRQFWTGGFLLNGSGISNGNLTLKYGMFIKPQQQIELTGGLGIKFPFSKQPLFNNNVLLPIDLQVSTRSFGATAHLIFSKGFPEISLRLLSTNKFDYNFMSMEYSLDANDAKEYRFGSQLSNAIFVSKKIVNNLFVVLQFRNEYRFVDKSNLIKSRTDPSIDPNVINTGGDIVFSSLQLSYSILRKWHVAAMFDYPLYRFYKGRQLSPSYSFAFSLTRDFDFNHKAEK